LALSARFGQIRKKLREKKKEPSGFIFDNLPCTSFFLSSCEAQSLRLVPKPRK
jgi:hypothetical protein